MRLTSRLLTLDPLEGNGLDGNQPPAPQPAPTIPAPNIPPPPSPHAASIVIAGKKTEADVATELESKKLQTRIAQLEDEKRRLMEVQSAPVTTVAAEQKKSWLEGGSFFD